MAGTKTVHKRHFRRYEQFPLLYGQETSKEIDSVPSPLFTGEYEINANKAKFQLKTIEVKEIRAAFSKIKTAKSLEIDNIFSYFLKTALSFIENAALAFLESS